MLALRKASAGLSTDSIESPIRILREQVTPLRSSVADYNGIGHINGYETWDGLAANFQEANVRITM